MEIKEFFGRYSECAVAFSGGADSAYLLYAAAKYAKRAKAYYVKTAFQPEFELSDAKRLSKKLGVDMRVIELDVLSDDKIAENPVNRCYFCKKRIFSAIADAAKADGFPVIADGTNASDKTDDRPGMKALAELGVRSPLRECGITKSEVRRLSKEAGLFTCDKPAYACLATRIPSGERITAEMLSCIEGAEKELFCMGFSDFRVRTYHGAAVLQFIPPQQEEAFFRRNEIIAALGGYFDKVLFDLKGRVQSE